MGDACKSSEAPLDVDVVASQFELLDSDTHRQALLEAIRARDVYRQLVEQLREENEKLKRGLVGPKSHRYKGEDDTQLSLQVLAELLGASPQDLEGVDPQQLAKQLAAEAEAEAAQAAGAGDGGDGDDGGAAPHRRGRKRTGRRTARQDLPKVRFEVLPEEVQRLGLDAFERIGEESSTTIERRASAVVEVTVVRPKFVAKTEQAEAAVEQAAVEQGRPVATDDKPRSWITIAPPPELPIERGMAGPGLLANVIVRRFDDHLPYYRLENVYEREGMRIGRSTLYGWLDALRELFAPLLAAILVDARGSPYLCVDATGVLVQAPDKCSRGHFWVLVAPGRHTIFAFSRRHDGHAVDTLLGQYEGYLVADAHVVYDHLYGEGRATEVGCWGHARAYFFKALALEPDVVRPFLDNLRVAFLLERKFADMPRKQRERMRRSKIKPLVDRHFEMCRQNESTALDGTDLQAAIRYSLNQQDALRRFLDDGRLPMTNNISERQLKRQAIGRKNWLFVGSDDGAEVNTTFTTLIASCHMHGIEPETYLRDLLCLLPSWPKNRVLELAPLHWNETRHKPETQQILDQNVFRKAILQLDELHSPQS